VKINAGHPRSLTQPFAGSYKKCGGEYIDLRQTEIDTFNNSTAWMSGMVDVRFGSLADISRCNRHVSFAPIADIEWDDWIAASKSSTIFLS
jgi:hypothetical protein